MKNSFLKFAKNWLIQSMISTLALSGILTTFAQTTVYADTTAQDSQAYYNTINPHNGAKQAITYCVNETSSVKVAILKLNDYSVPQTVKTLVDNETKYEGCYTELWDGTNEGNQIVPDGQYYYGVKVGDSYFSEWIYVISENPEPPIPDDDEIGIAIITKKNNVSDSTTDPRLRNVYVTKSSFDPGRGEYEYIVFTLTARADVKIRLYDEDGEKVETLVNEADLSRGTYTVKWDGAGYEGEEQEFTYKIEVENEDGQDSATGEIEVARDEKSNRRPNIYKDKVSEIPYKPDDNELTISFKLDKEGEVTVEIRDGNYIIDTLTEDEWMETGYNSVEWDGKDEDGDYVENGIYEYKIISINDKGKDVERGKFSVEEAEDAIANDNDDDDDDDGDDNVCIDCGDNGNGFYDISKNYKYYDAIMWAQKMGIFEGYYGNYFMPNEAISRAEALKVILKVMNVNVADYNNEYFCFSDVCNSDAWYMPYLKTGLALGVVTGYPDDTFKPNQSVNRIEALVMLLRTGELVNNIAISTQNCGQPYYDTPNNSTTKWYIYYVWMAKNYSLTDSYYYFRPADVMTRGEMADMLYRYYYSPLEN